MSTDLLVYDSLAYLKEQSSELKHLINKNYNSLHSLILFTYLKNEDINIDYLTNVFVVAQLLNVINEMNTKDLIDIAYSGYLTIEETKKYITNLVGIIV